MVEKIFTCEQDSVRMDIFLADKLDETRSQIADLIKKNLVNVNNKLAIKAGLKLKYGDFVHVRIPTKDCLKENISVDFDVSILYEDEDILVINKPPFLTVHPAPSVKEATLVDWLKSNNFTLSTISGEERSGIVHRLDKETSGALVVAKNNKAHVFLSKQLEDRTMGRYYLALIDYPLKNDIIVDKPISRNSKNRTKMIISNLGRNSKSAFVSLCKNEKIELISAKLFTGRTHQIRVHLNHIGRHILGDDLYGFKSQKDKIRRVMLHAYCLYLVHPSSKKLMTFTAPLYEDFSKIMYTNFNKESVDEVIKMDSIFSRFDNLY